MNQLLKQYHYSEFLSTKNLKEHYSGEKVHECVQRCRKSIKLNKFCRSLYDKQLSNLASGALCIITLYFGNDCLFDSLVLNRNFREKRKSIRDGNFENYSVSRAITCTAEYEKRYSNKMSI
ncbi:hypothetical protein IGI91_002455 [Enterococcus sp. AZ154]